VNLENVNKLLIVRLSSFGDILLTTPLIRSVKNSYPDLKIDFALREEYRDLLKFNPYLNELHLYSGKYKSNPLLLQKLNENEYDLVIDLQNNLRSRQLLRGFRKSKILFNKRNLDKFLLVHFKINRLKDATSIPERYAQTLLDLELDNKGLDLFTKNETSHLLLNKNNLIGLCPGSKHFTKMWPAEYFIELGNLLQQNGYKIAVFGGKDDKQMCEYINSNLNDSINLCNDNDILQTAADIKICKAIYCNDSGLMHAASAVGVPVISIFGSTVKEFGFSPYNCKNLILENNSLSCRPCTHIGRANCPKKHFNCMKQISPRTAFDSLNLILS